MGQHLNARQLRELRDTPIGQAGNRIAKAMALADVSLNDISKVTGFSISYVGDVKRGRFQNISRDNGHMFAQFFGCTFDDLFPCLRAVAS